MNNSDFYVTLPSNSSLELYPDNTLAQYTTQLPEPIVLSNGEWETALAEIMYPPVFNNITEGDAWYELVAFRRITDTSIVDDIDGILEEEDVGLDSHEEDTTKPIHSSIERSFEGKHSRPPPNANSHGLDFLSFSHHIVTSTLYGVVNPDPWNALVSDFDNLHRYLKQILPAKWEELFGGYATLLEQKKESR